MKTAARYLQVLFYLVAGINHFWHPLSYYGFIPPYLPAPHLINLFTGAAEILLSLLLFFSATRKWAAIGILCMLLAFIPAHIYFIQRGSCIPGLCVPPWVGWTRLLVLQPLLMSWAWWCRK